MAQGVQCRQGMGLRFAIQAGVSPRADEANCWARARDACNCQLASRLSSKHPLPPARASAVKSKPAPARTATAAWLANSAPWPRSSSRSLSRWCFRCPSRKQLWAAW